MANEKIVKFFEGVLSKTREGRIPWEPTVQDSNFIAAFGGGFGLSISAWTEPVPGSTPTMRALGQGIQRYSLVLRDQIGREVARITEADEGIHRDDMRALYETARRQALRPDEKIDDALQALRTL
jgi:hypothetical protein